MRKRSDISSLLKRILSVLALVLLTGILIMVPVSCKNKAKDGNRSRQEEAGGADETEFVNNLEDVDSMFFQAKGYFLGKIDNRACILSVETADKSGVIGKYYRIDTLKSSARPIHFKLLREGNQYRLVTDSINSLATFSIAAGSSAILGTITTQDKPGKTYRIDF